MYRKVLVFVAFIFRSSFEAIKKSLTILSLLIMRSAIELAVPVALLNFPVDRSLLRSSVL